MRGQSYARGGASIHLDQCGLLLYSPLPFLPLIEEKEAKEDQGTEGAAMLAGQTDRFTPLLWIPSV